MAGTGSLETIERECAVGRTAPRVSLDDIKENIAGEYYTTADKAFDGCPISDSLKLLTICVLVLKNGFTIIGKSAPASAENFDADLGRKLAYDDAVKQIWPLMGYELRERLYKTQANG